MRLLSVLMPRERQFFTLFNSHASLVVAGAKAPAKSDSKKSKKQQLRAEA